MSRTSVIASTLLVLSCSSTVELSTAPQLVQSADPTVLGVINETVSNIIVDDERVYWLGTTGPNVVWRGALRSCAKKNCATSLMTYGNTTVNEAVGYGLENGQIYWLSLKSGHQQAWQLLTCAAMGWVGDPLLVQDDISSDPTATAFSSDSMYMAMNGYPGLVRVPLSGGSAQQLPYNEGIINALAVQGDYLYWLGSSHGYETSPTALERTRTDGTGTVEVLLDDIEIPTNLGALVTTGLAVDSKYAYWSQGTLRGEVDRCALTGCSAPDVIAAPVRSPTTVALDGARIYWQHDTATNGLALSSCMIENCQLIDPLAQGVDAAASLAIDDSYVYTATTGQEIDPNIVRIDPSTSIRRIPK